MATGSLSLDILDARGNGIRDTVRLELAAVGRSERYRNTVFVQKTVQLGGIECDPLMRYQVTVWPSDYRVSQFIVPVTAGKTNTRQPLYLPVDPSKVTDIEAPAFEKLDAGVQRVLEQSEISDVFPGQTGKALYDALDPVRKACLLNITTKASNTRLLSGQTCLDLLSGILRLRGDRFFARTVAALREEVQNARDIFREVSELLHHPPDGYTAAGSFKTNDKHGNLQVSFFRKGTTGDDYLVDVDIDEAAGIEHGFEVVGNALADHTTSPYDIRDILIKKQSLDPGYSFVFAKEAEIQKAAVA
jgi:hypothetical protein